MFIERDDMRVRNARALRRTRVAPAQLADGRNGIMVSIEGPIICISADEAIDLSNRLIDCVESTNETA